MHDEQPQQQPLEEYVHSLRPTTTGSVIRSQGDIVHFTQGMQPVRGGGDDPDGSYISSLRHTEAGEKLRQTGEVKSGVGGEGGMIDYDKFDSEKHSVRHLVQHFRSRESMDMEQYQKEQQRRAQVEQQRSQQKWKQQYEQEEQQRKQRQLQQQQMQEQKSLNRNSMADCLAFDASSGMNYGAGGIADPSAILGGKDIAQRQTNPKQNMMQSPFSPPSPPPSADTSNKVDLRAKFALMLADLDQPLPPMKPLPGDLVMKTKQMTVMHGEGKGGGDGGGRIGRNLETSNKVPVSYRST